MKSHTEMPKEMLFVVLLILISSAAISANPLVLDEEKQASYSLGEYMSVLEAQEGKNLSFENAQSLFAQGRFEEINRPNPNFGYNFNEHWFHLNVSNKTEREKWVFFINTPLLDYIDLYWREQGTGKWNSYETGRFRSFDSRGEIDHVSFALETELKNGKEYEFYLRIQTTSPFLLPISLQTPKEVNRYSRNEHLAYGIYFGVMLVMVLYNLFVFAALRDVNYLYYVLSIAGTLIIFSAVSGYQFRYLYPDIPILNNYVAKPSMGIMTVPTILFAMTFLRVRLYNKWLYRWLWTLIGLSLISVVLTVTEIRTSATNTAVSLTAVSLLVSGIVALKNGNKYARFYTAAWLLYIIGGLNTTLRNAGHVPISFLSDHGAEIGSAAEVILLSLALSDRYRTIRQEKEKATKRNLRIQKEANETLEQKVRERTIQLQESNEELNQINEELQAILETVQFQKGAIELKNKEITSSLNYAQRIQQAMLPSEKLMTKVMSGHFTLFKPRDLVSGDFYFFYRQNGLLYLAAVDCTGHGVPGAFMSMIGMNQLLQLIMERKLWQPNEILKEMHLGVQKALRQDQTGNRDGMDVALCVIDTETRKLHFAGAKNPLLIVNQKQTQLIKADTRCVGGVQKGEVSFTMHTHQINEGDRFYIYSDGYQDQFGGPDKRKFMSKRFRELLAQNSGLSFEEQHLELEHSLQRWIKEGDEKQVDDILVIGFEL